MKVPRRKDLSFLCVKRFSTSRSRLEILSVEQLPNRIQPSYHGSSECQYLRKSTLTSTETKGYDLLSLQWPSAPRNILLVKKENATTTTEAVLEFARSVTVQGHRLDVFY